MSQLPPSASKSKDDDSKNKDKRKVSCVHCRRIKRKCDGEQPCLSCVKKNIACEFSQMDRRTQRYSIGYIKSLETNNEVYENTLAHLVSLRSDPQELIAKLEALSTSYSTTERLNDLANELEGEDEIRPHNSADDAIESQEGEPYQYFGPGSIYHYLRFTRPDKEPIVTVRNSPESGVGAGAVTIAEDYEYVALLVHAYFEQSNPNIFKYLLDKDLILRALDARDLSGPYLNEDLLYALCANCEILTYAEADAYCDLVLELLFTATAKSSIAVSQAYTMLAVHTLGKGQMSKGWFLAGLGIRAGLEVGFDIEKDTDEPLVANRCFMGTMLIDTYICMSFGRKPTIQTSYLPVLRLRLESDVDFYNLKYCVELVEMTRSMLHATYKPVLYGEDPRVNYLLKFNRSKAFNVKLLKWKLALEPCCAWLYSLMKSSPDLTNENHVLKYFYYYILLFLNKPFLHVPKQHLTVYIFEEIAKEMLMIVQQKLQKYEDAGIVIPDAGDSTGISNLSDFSPTDLYKGPEMDLCVLTLLCHVLVTLITTQPEEYLYLERHYKVFAKFLQLRSPRKYKANNNPITRLHSILSQFKSKIKRDALTKLEESVASAANPHGNPPGSQLSSSPSNNGSPFSSRYSLGGSPIKEGDKSPLSEQSGSYASGLSKPSEMEFYAQSSLATHGGPQYMAPNGAGGSSIQTQRTQNGQNQMAAGFVQQGLPSNQDGQQSFANHANGQQGMTQGGLQSMMLGSQHMPTMQHAQGSLPYDANQRVTDYATNQLNFLDPQLQVFQQQLDMLTNSQEQFTMNGISSQMNHLSTGNGQFGPQGNDMGISANFATMNSFNGVNGMNMDGVHNSSGAQMDASSMQWNPATSQYIPQLSSDAQYEQFYYDKMHNRVPGERSNFTYGHSSLDAPYLKMMGTFFSNGGDEFMLEKERVNWAGLFNT